MHITYNTKYRVEEHHANETTYLLHGTYNTQRQAQNKINKIVASGITTENNLYLVKQITTITRETLNKNFR